MRLVVSRDPYQAWRRVKVVFTLLSGRSPLRPQGA
jgi:hypothetical protein